MQPRNASELTLVGRILLWGVRHWVARRCSGRDLPRYVIHTFERPPLSPALLRELESLMAQVTVGARRRLRVGKPGDPRLTPDESTLVLAIQAARLEIEDVCRLLVSELVTGSSLRSVSRALERLGAELAVTGTSLQPAERYAVPAPGGAEASTAVRSPFAATPASRSSPGSS